MDKIPMVNVTARILDQNGKPVVKARIAMRLTTVERYCGLIVPRETSAYTDANGNATLRVWPNELGTESSEYKVTISYGDSCSIPCGGSGVLSPSMSRSFYVVVPNADCNLFDITELPPYEQRGSGQVITAEVAAFASQAANAAQRAENSVATIAAIRDEAQAIADNANSAKFAAQEAAEQAARHEHQAQDLIDGVDGKISHFENAVTQQVETTANRLTVNATACISQAETTALLAIEARSGECLAELATTGEEMRQNALAAIANGRELALGDIHEARDKTLEELREEAALFGEDFEALTERAESAAKRAGCSAAAASNAATKSCLCADRAEAAAIGLEDARAQAEIAAAEAKEAHACAHADAIRAENAATEAHIDAAKAQASEAAAVKSAELADCCAKKSCKCAEDAFEAQQRIAEDKEYINQAVPRVVEAVEAAQERLATLEEDARRAHCGAAHAQDAARRAENILSLARGDNRDASWLMPNGADRGDILDLPVTYVVGSNMIRLFYGGMLMCRGIQYKEIGEEGETSSRVRLLIPILENSTMNVWAAAPHVTGDLLAAEEKAGAIIDSLKESETQAETQMDRLLDTLNILAKAGDIEAEKAKEQASLAEAAAKRADDQAERVGQLVILSQGTNLEASWITAQKLSADDVVDLPISYIAGRSTLRLFWGGMLMMRGMQYEEAGEPDTVATQIRLKIDIPANSQMNAWSVATAASGADMQQKLLEAQRLLERAAEAVKLAEEARDKALAAADAAITGTISTVPSMGEIAKRSDGFFIVDKEMEEDAH